MCTQTRRLDSHAGCPSRGRRTAELATPALLARLGYRLVLAAGLVLLGAPVLVLTVSASLATILVVSAVRGVGLAILVVAGSALVATLVPRERRSEGLGLLGVVVGVPAVLALPLGVWLAERVGFTPVFIAGAASLVCLAAIPALPGRQPGAAPSVGVLAGLLVGGVVAAAIGMLALAFTASAPAVVAGAVLLGLGFGVAQNASLTLMFERASASSYDMVSAVWNLAYDAGLGLGAAGFGVLAARAGYAGAFGLVAVSMLVALAPAWRDRGWLTPGEEEALRA